MPIALILRDIKYMVLKRGLSSRHRFRCGKSRRDGVQTFLYSEVNFMMHSAQMFATSWAAFRSGEPGRPTAKDAAAATRLQSVPDLPRDGLRILGDSGNN